MYGCPHPFDRTGYLLFPQTGLSASPRGPCPCRPTSIASPSQTADWVERGVTAPSARCNRTSPIKGIRLRQEQVVGWHPRPSALMDQGTPLSGRATGSNGNRFWFGVSPAIGILLSGWAGTHGTPGRRWRDSRQGFGGCPVRCFGEHQTGPLVLSLVRLLGGAECVNSPASAGAFAAPSSACVGWRDGPVSSWVPLSHQVGDHAAFNAPAPVPACNSLRRSLDLQSGVYLNCLWLAIR